MTNLEEVKYGWNFMADLLGADAGSKIAFSDYVQNTLQNESIAKQNIRIQEINAAIDQLADSINTHPSLNLDPEQLKGFIAEEWHAGTFNIDAIKKGSEHRVWTLQETGYGSVDIDTNFGKQYSLKYANVCKRYRKFSSCFK